MALASRPIEFVVIYSIVRLAEGHRNFDGKIQVNTQFFGGWQLNDSEYKSVGFGGKCFRALVLENEFNFLVQFRTDMYWEITHCYEVLKMY